MHFMSRTTAISSKRHPSKIIARLARQNSGNAESLVESLSNKMNKALGRTEPPFQTEAFEYATLAGAEVVEADIASAGLLSVFNGKILIEVNSNDTPERQSYTVCHEVAHIELRRAAKYLAVSASRKAHRGRAINEVSSRTEERMADQFAASVLMPKEVFREKARDLTPSLENAIFLAQMFRTSLGATLRRIVSLGVWECVMIWCNPERMKGEDQWAVRIHEFKSSMTNRGLVCPRHRYVWWGGKAVQKAFVSDPIVKDMITIHNDVWKFEGKREWHYVRPVGRQNRVMAMLVPAAAS